MIDSLPRYRNHESRQGHNLGHDFSFTSSTGQLLTLFGHRMDAKDTIQGRIDMFTRTQPLSQPANVEIEEFIDYFFVPLDMLYSGMGDFIYQVNEPYSSITQQVLSSQLNGQLPVLDWSFALQGILNDIYYTYTIQSEGTTTRLGINVLEDDGGSDYYGFDNYFLSVYRNLFHNYYNPNGLFKSVRDAWDTTGIHYVYPADYFQPNVMPLYLMAYNCIYQHFYRLDDREEFKASQYNIDGILYDNEQLHENFDKQFYCLKYRPRFFDYFTSAKVAPLINSNNILAGSNTTDLTRINNYLSSQNIVLRSKSGDNPTGVDVSTQVGPTKVGTATAVSLGVSTSTFRSMFAVEKLLSITNRAKKTYDAQVMAHLGVDVPMDYYHNIQYLGTQKSTIKVGEVVATASTEDSPLGDIAGKGYAVMGDKGVKFTAPCHGVFMAIYSAVPKVRYYAPLEKHAMITDRLSFYQPEFARLGMQPIFGYEAFAQPENNYTANTSILGWQMRYDELKKRFNKVSPAFVDTIIRTEVPESSPKPQYIQSFNDWHTWTVVERPYQFTQNQDIVGLSRFLANPQMLNGLMAVQYLKSSDWYDAYKDTGYYLFDTQLDLDHKKSFEWDVAGLFKRDPLLHFAKCDFKIVNKIPDNTLPSLNVL